jgi:nucleotide-binding universal stress UspA family protein
MTNAGTARRVLVAMDFSPAATAALSWAEVIGSTPGSRLWLVHAVPWALTGAGIAADRLLQRELVSRAEGELERIAKRLRHRGLEVETRVGQGAAASNIVGRLAADVGADLVITGTRGRGGLRRLALGSTADRLVHELRVPLLVVHESDRTPTTDPPLLIVATDLSAEAAAASRAAIALLPRPAATVLVHSMARAKGERWFEKGDPRQSEVVRHLASQRLQNEAEKLAATADARWVLRVEPPAEAIIAEARTRRASLVVVGARHASRLSQRILGTTATRVLQSAPCPVLISPALPAARRKVRDRAQRAEASHGRALRSSAGGSAPEMALTTGR